MGLFSFFNRTKYVPSEPESPRSVRVWSGGSPVTPDSSMKVAAFHSGVTYLSTQIAKLPVQIKDSDNAVLDGHISNLVNINPNNEMSAFYFWMFLVQQAILHGNGFAEIERDTVGRVKALHPIPSESMQITRLDGRLVYRVVGGSVLNTGEDVYLRSQDVLKISNFHTKDGIVGQGLIWYAAEILGITLGADKFANSLYSNGGLPSGVLELTGNLSDAAMERLKKSWSDAHSGRQVGGTAVLEEGVAFKPISYSPDILQFLESRKFSVIEIARFLRIPPTKLYATEAANYNNVEHSNLEVVVDVLDAWARNIESEIDIKLLNNRFGGRRAELDLQAVFRGDMNTRSQYFTRMMQNASMTPNEIRRREGLAPYDGGDRYFIATNNFSPADRIDEMVDSQISKTETKPQEGSKDKVDSVVVDYLQKKTIKH